MAYLTSEIALAQTLQAPAHTQGGHCPLLCMAILPVLSDVQQVQQIQNVSAHQTVHKVFSKTKHFLFCIGGSLFRETQLESAISSHVGNWGMLYAIVCTLLNIRKISRLSTSTVSVLTDNPSMVSAQWYSAEY